MGPSPSTNGLSNPFRWHTPGEKPLWRDISVSLCMEAKKNSVYLHLHGKSSASKTLVRNQTNIEILVKCFYFQEGITGVTESRRDPKKEACLTFLACLNIVLLKNN